MIISRRGHRNAPSAVRASVIVNAITFGVMLLLVPIAHWIDSLPQYVGWIGLLFFISAVVLWQALGAFIQTLLLKRLFQIRTNCEYAMAIFKFNGLANLCIYALLVRGGIYRPDPCGF